MRAPCAARLHPAARGTEGCRLALPPGPERHGQSPRGGGRSRRRATEHILYALRPSPLLRVLPRPPLVSTASRGGRHPGRSASSPPAQSPRLEAESKLLQVRFYFLLKDHSFASPSWKTSPVSHVWGGAQCSQYPAPRALSSPRPGWSRSPAVLTRYIGAGAVVGSVLHQSVVARQLLWLTVLCPRRLRALG